MSNDHDQNKENVSANTNVVEHDSTNWKPSEKSADAEQVTQANVETVNNEQNESSSEISQPDNKENEVTNSNDRQRAVAMGAKLSPEARDEAIAEQKERSNIPDPVTTETANADVELTTEDAVMGVGVDDNVKKNINIYPNPTTGIINIDGAEGADVAVYSITGKLIGEYNGSEKVDLSIQPNGIYFVKVYNDSFVTTKRITLNR